MQRIINRSGPHVVGRFLGEALEFKHQAMSHLFSQIRESF